MTEISPIVFLHYSWDSEEHKEWVLSLAERLIADGVDLIFDRYDLKIGSNINYFMEKIEHANKVIIITTPKYKSKADNRSSGIGYEYQIITTELAKSLVTNNKFISILRIGTIEDSVPKLLQSFLHLDMTQNNNFENEYLTLLKNIYDYPVLEKPLKGSKPNFLKLQEELEHKPESGISKVLELGINQKEVREILGEPQTTGLVETYWSHGLQVYYNRHWDKTDGIMIRKQPSGISYDGLLLGIKLGESFAEIKSKLGNPINWALPDIYTSFAFYEIEQRFLMISICRNKPREDLNDLKLGSIYAIGYCEKHSVLACEPIVAITIEQIRTKSQLTYLEKSVDEYEVDFNSNIFNENYIIYPTQYNEFGGYFVSVFFEQSETMIDFWLYDLCWSYFTIRMIIERNQDLSL